MSQALRSVIDAHGVPMGVTTTGREWCIKALHPSDPLTEIRGIPDHSAVPTVCMNYQSTFTLRSTSANTWYFDVTLLPHPLYFGYWVGDATVSNPESGFVQTGNFWNSQLVQGVGIPTNQVLYNAWYQLAQRWRLAYFGCTVIQDGPDLANQGTIVVSQAPLTPRISNVSTYVAPALATRRVALFDAAMEGPNFQRSQAMPNTMIGRSKEGAYVPLKLTETCQDWFSPSDDYGIVTPSGDASSETMTLTQSQNPTFPFENVVNTYASATGVIGGSVVPALLSTNVAHVCARNLSNATSFTFFFRVGIEMQLASSSNLTPQLKLSPPYDPQALDAYFILSREMKDAYPSDYNDRGRMWEVISKAVRKTAPILGLLPGAAPYVRAATAITQAGDAIAARRKKKKASPRKRTPR